MRSHRVATAIVFTSLGIIIGCHIWLAHFGSDSAITSEDAGPVRRTVRISRWRQGHLEAIDSRRIVLHETSGRGYLNARQSCAVESAARHNPDRPIQVFMRWSSDDTGNSTDALLTVLAHYNNVEIVQIDDVILYSNNTALHNWFKMKRRENGHHLSDYVRSVTLFKGGGLFLDMDKVITIKPLTWSKWNNFFVQRQGGVITVEMLHLLHGHHLIDEIILNMAKVDDSTGNGILAAAIDASVNKICAGSVKKNQCLDVRLVDEEDVILPPFDSLFWGSSLSLGIHSKGEGYHIVKKAIVNHGAVLMEWVSMAGLDRNLFDSMYLALMEDHCPLTLVNAQHFPLNQ